MKGAIMLSQNAIAEILAVISKMVIADAEISDSAVTSILEQFTVLIAPDRGEMITEPIVTEFNSQTQQGAPALTEVPPAFAGMPPGSNSFYRSFPL
jgi:hypothetical protein